MSKTKPTTPTPTTDSSKTGNLNIITNMINNLANKTSSQNAEIKREAGRKKS